MKFVQCSTKHLDLDHCTLRRMARKRILELGFSQKQATVILNGHPCGQLMSWNEGWTLHPSLRNVLLVLRGLTPPAPGATLQS